MTDSSEEKITKVSDKSSKKFSNESKWNYWLIHLPVLAETNNDDDYDDDHDDDVASEMFPRIIKNLGINLNQLFIIFYLFSQTNFIKNYYVFNISL